MTTASWSTVIDQSSDAGFRNWGSELNTKFAAVGMVQTADTGQINWTTVTRQSTINTAAGYEIWKLSSGNLYFKIEYGTGSMTLTTPSMWITTGTGSNGSGTLTGQLTTRTQAGATATAISSTTTNYQSFLCATANYFGLAHKLGSAGVANQARHILGACQTVDSTGAATSVGFYQAAASGVGSNTNTGVTQCVATAAGVTGAVNGGGAVNPNLFLLPNNAVNPPPSSGDGSGNNQAFLYWHSILGTTPMTPVLHFATVLATDLTVGVSAPMTLIGATSHTYLAASEGYAADAGGKVSTSAFNLIMLFE